MLTAKLLIVVTYLHFVNARIQVPFVGTKTGDIDVAIAFNLSVGTPGQEIQFVLEDNNIYDFSETLYVLNKTAFAKGSFDAEKSSTFSKVGTVLTDYEKSVNATDTIKFGDTTLKAKPIQVVNERRRKFSYFESGGKMGISRFDNFSAECQNKSINCTTFVQSVLQDFDDQVLVLVFDKIEVNLKSPFNGQLILGDKAEDYCQSNWAFLPERTRLSKSEPQWTFKITSVSIGKYTWESPKEYAFFEFFEPNINFPSKIYNTLLKVLDVSEANIISCNSTLDIIFEFGDNKLLINPSAYVIKNSNNECYFNGKKSSGDFYQFPASVLSESCLLYDYQRIGVSFTSRV